MLSNDDILVAGKGENERATVAKYDTKEIQDLEYPNLTFEQKQSREAYDMALLANDDLFAAGYVTEAATAKKQPALFYIKQ